MIGPEWGHADWKGSFIRMKQTATNGEPQKTKKCRRPRAPVPPQQDKVLKGHHKRAAAAALAAGKSLGPYLFPSPTDAFMDPSKLRNEFGTMLRMAGLRAVTFHSLRHTALTEMAESGVPMAALQRIAVHSSIDVTPQYYPHARPEARRETAAALQTLYGESASKMRVDDWERSDSGQVSGFVEPTAGIEPATC